MKKFDSAKWTARLVLACGVLPLAISASIPATGGTLGTTQPWISSPATHIYGLPGLKAKQQGSLTMDDTELVFVAKGMPVHVPVSAILAVSTDSERVELWGLKGRLLRMAIPNGGGLAAAAVMHHKVTMLSVEFVDTSGGLHSGVFSLPANEAAAAVRKFTEIPAQQREPGSTNCASGSATKGVVRTLAPSANQLELPAAYRGLVYERLIDRLSRTKGIRKVYRDGEVLTSGECPEFTVELSITGFKPGSQVKRAVLGPVGMFVATTQMKFHLRVARNGSPAEYRTSATATVRGESESLGLTDAVAKKLVKDFSAAQKGHAGWTSSAR